MSGTDATRADQQPPAAKPRSRTRVAVQVVVSLVVAIFYYLFNGIDLAQVWTDIWAMTWLELTTLAMISVWNLATYALAFDPRGTPHGFQNVGDTPGRLLVISTPSGVERYFEQYAELPPGPVDPAVLAALMHTSWAEFAGPPLAVSDPSRGLALPALCSARATSRLAGHHQQVLHVDGHGPVAGLVELVDQLTELGHQRGVALRRQHVPQGYERAVVALLELQGGLPGVEPCRRHPRLELDRPPPAPPGAPAPPQAHPTAAARGSPQAAAHS
jgi:hypothetical protein